MQRMGINMWGNAEALACVSSVFVMNENPEPLSIVLFLLFFVGMWLVVTFLLSYTTGWASLTRVYRATQPFHGERWTPFHAQLGNLGPLGSFGNSLNIGANGEGLHLSVFILFRVNCPPLFIPWIDVFIESKNFAGYRYKEFRFRQVPSVPLRLSEKLGEKIAALSHVNSKGMHTTARQHVSDAAERGGG
jgi:hypothetical protein